jgi:hypothetical protein
MVPQAPPAPRRRRGGVLLRVERLVEAIAQSTGEVGEVGVM